MTAPQSSLQVKEIDQDLKNLLWDATISYVLLDSESDHNYRVYVDVFREFFKKPRDFVKRWDSDNRQFIKKWFFEAKWYEIYNFIEYLCSDKTGIQKFFNNILEQERSAYRFVDSILAPISNELEQDEIQAVFANPEKYSGAKIHLKRAIELFSQKPNPDLRNAVKEAISAVESVAKVASGKSNATLGDALKEMEKSHVLPTPLKLGLEKLYGYTNGPDGIRHALIEEKMLDDSEAHFMIVTCSAFVNFLVSKIN